MSVCVCGHGKLLHANERLMDQNNTGHCNAPVKSRDHGTEFDMVCLCGEFREVDEYANPIHFNHKAVLDSIRTVNESTGGEKEIKKTFYHLIPVDPLAELARLYEYGANKYQPRNWEKGFDWSKGYDALMRHLQAFWAHEHEGDIDPENGAHHLASVVFYAFALMEWKNTHPELDDRPGGQDGQESTPPANEAAATPRGSGTEGSRGDETAPSYNQLNG